MPSLLSLKNCLMYFLKTPYGISIKVFVPHPSCLSEIMPRRCNVFRCKGNYPGQPYSKTEKQPLNV